MARPLGRGIDGAAEAVERLRSGENILPPKIGREALDAYYEISKRVLEDPRKATETGRILQELRQAVIEELRRRKGQ